MTRTGGFNTVEIGRIHDSTAMMFISLIVIGGGSTPSAGGIKVKTFIVLLLATVVFIRRRTQLPVFGRSLGQDEVMKVLALAMVSILAVIVGIFLISLSHNGDFLDLAFEATSAFGTVGCLEAPPASSTCWGRAVVVGVTLIRRVGPLTLGLFLAALTVQPRKPNACCRSSYAALSTCTARQQSAPHKPAPDQKIRLGGQLPCHLLVPRPFPSATKPATPDFGSRSTR